MRQRKAKQPFSLKPRNGIFYVHFFSGGRRFRLSTDTGDPDAAQTAAVEIWSKASRAGKLPRGQQDQLALELHVATWIEHLDHRAGEYGDGYAKRRRYDMGYLVGWTSLSQITTASWDLKMRELHAKLGWRSLQHLANTLRHFLRWCEETIDGYKAPKILSPPSKLVRRTQSVRRAMTEEERDLFLATLLTMGVRSDDKAYALRAHRIYRVLFWSALRKGELEALCPSWVDDTEEIIRIPASDDKAARAEVVDLHPVVKAALTEERALHNPLALNSPLFGHFEFKELFRATITKAGISAEGLTPHHVTRHTCATLAAAAAPNLESIMAVGRWKSPQVAGRYLHPTLKAARAALRRMK